MQPRDEVAQGLEGCIHQFGATEFNDQDLTQRFGDGFYPTSVIPRPDVAQGFQDSFYPSSLPGPDVVEGFQDGLYPSALSRPNVVEGFQDSLHPSALPRSDVVDGFQDCFYPSALPLPRPDAAQGFQDGSYEFFGSSCESVNPELRLRQPMTSASYQVYPMETAQIGNVQGIS